MSKPWSNSTAVLAIFIVAIWALFDLERSIRAGPHFFGLSIPAWLDAVLQILLVIFIGRMIWRGRD